MIIRRIRRLVIRAMIALAVIGGVLFMTVRAEAAEIRQRVVVESDQVTLGDLFDGIAVEQLEQKVSPAPAPGRRAVFDYRTLGRLARAYRVSWQPASTLDRVIIERAANILDSAVIEQELVKAITADMAGDAGDLDVSLDNRAANIALPVDIEPSIAVTRLNHDPISGRFTATVVAPAYGDSVYETTLTGRSIPIVNVPVLAEPMRKGDIISERDIVMIKMPAERMTADVLINEADLVGMTPRRAVSANPPVRDSDVNEPIVVERGAPVTIRLNHGSIALTAKGRAMDNAARGDVLRVMNVSSNRVVDAIAIGPNSVEIALP